MLPRVTGPGSAGLAEQDRAAIAGPARLCVLRALRTLESVRRDRHAGLGNAARDEIVHRRARAALAEGEVVFRGAALVTVSFDEHEVVGVRAEPLGIQVQDRPVAGPDLGAGEGE